MFKCENCGKETKTKSGLTSHQKKCLSVEQKPEPKVGTEIAEELNRRIAKLEMSIKQCYDAETKYRLECELKELKGRL